MKYCVNCGTELNDDAKFCSKCGTAAKITEAAEEAEKINIEPDTENVDNTVADVNVETESSDYTEQNSEPETAETAIVSEVINSSDTTVEPEPATRKTNYPAKTIIGFIFSIVGIANGGIAAITAFLALFPYLSAVCMFCAIYCGIIGLACSIVGMIFSNMVYKAENDNKKARIGKILSLVGIIAGGFGIVFGIIFGLIGMTFLASQLLNTYGGMNFGK